MTDVPGIELMSEVKIRQSNKSKGFRTRRGYLATFAAGPNVKSHYDVALPNSVDLMNGDYWLPSTAHQENQLWVEVHPNLPLAALVSGSAISGGVASGDAEVTLNAQGKGALNALLTSDGVRQSDEVYFRLTSVPSDVTDFSALRMAKWDGDAGKLLSPSGAAFGLTATSGDPVFVTTRWEDGTFLAPGEYVQIGSETVGSSFLPAGVSLRFIMLNKGTDPVVIGFNLTYMHS